MGRAGSGTQTDWRGQAGEGREGACRWQQYKITQDAWAEGPRAPVKGFGFTLSHDLGPLRHDLSARQETQSQLSVELWRTPPLLRSLTSKVPVTG